MNGYMFEAEKGELENVAVSGVVGHLEVEAIAVWLQAHGC